MGWVVNATPRPLYPRERPGTHCIGSWVGLRARWTGTENFASTGIRSPDRPARSVSLYRLSCPYMLHTYIDLVITLYMNYRTLRIVTVPRKDSRILRISRSQWTARSKTWVCGRSLAGILGSNHTGGMDVCCECCVTRPGKSYPTVVRRCL
jgi:hypothetical protein